MKIIYICSVWGLEDLPTIEDRLTKIKEGGFDGVELDVPLDIETCKRIRKKLDELDMVVVAQQWRTRGQTPDEHMVSFEEQYERALELNPIHLNSHTGCDHFDLEDNLAIFDHATALTAKFGLSVIHETHRSRALFSVPSTMKILDARPELLLTADFSHWCCVHESLLEDQQSSVERAIGNSYAIHARVGHAQGPQITDPRDPLWQPNLAKHLDWWKKIVETRRAEGVPVLTICPEFGPSPYMTLLPHARQPIANLWDINCYMRDWLRENL